MPTMNISLPEALKAFVEERVSGGGYGTVSEYFRELIREDQKRRAEAKLEALLFESLNSSPAKPLTKAELDEVRRVVRERIVERKKKFV